MTSPIQTTLTDLDNLGCATTLVAVPLEVLHYALQCASTLAHQIAVTGVDHDDTDRLGQLEAALGRASSLRAVDVA